MADETPPPPPDPDATVLRPETPQPRSRGSRSWSGAAAPDSSGPPIPDFPVDCRAGDMVGDYRLVRKLSSGGFGTVFVAERVHPFVKEVALKVVRSDRTHDERWLARFDMERRLLAQLQHPHIAALLDGGNSVSGQMFLVMELVKGEPITRYCDARKLRIADRLRIFLQLCEAMQYAHGKGVIHRDLSPGNVLVAEDASGAPQVKVIDFGIAKSNLASAAPPVAMTSEEYLPGTPGYSSPEQFEPGAPRVDVRSDIYSMGAILYELLAGSPPYDPQLLRFRGWEAIHQILQQQPPRAPSAILETMATSDTKAAEAVAAARHERLGRLAGELRAELEWIPLQALRAEQRDRYQTVQSLAEDVTSYLDGRPLHAAPESRAYRTRKFMRRHWRPISAAAALLVAALATTAAVSVLLLQRNRALETTKLREQELERVVAFQAERLSDLSSSEQAGLLMAEEVLGQAAQRMAQDGVPPADREAALAQLHRTLLRLNHAEIAKILLERIVLRPATERARGDYAGSPLLQASLLQSLGQVHAELGDAEQARPLFKEALALYQTERGDRDPRAVRTQLWLARIDGSTDGAIEAARAVLEQERSHGEAGSPAATDAMRLLRDRLPERAGGLPEAVSLARQIASTSAAGADDATALADQVRLGELLIPEQRQEAITVLERCVDRMERSSAPRALQIRATSALGTVLSTESNSPERRRRARALLESSVTLTEKLWGERHPRAFAARSDFAACLVRDWPDDPEAMRQANQTIERSRSLARAMAVAPDQSVELNTLAVQQGTLAGGPGPQALELHREAWQIARMRQGESSETALQIQRALAVTERQAGNLARAQELLAQAMQLRGAARERASSREMLSLALELALTQRIAKQLERAVETLEIAQRAAQGDPERGLDSESRWFVSSALLGMLEELPADGARIAAQRDEVARLRAATERSRNHGLRDWRAIR